MVEHVFGCPFSAVWDGENHCDCEQDRLEVVVIGSDQLQQDVAEILAEMEAEGFFASISEEDHK